MSIISEKLNNHSKRGAMSEDERMYSNTLIVANTVSIVSAVLQSVSGGKLASLDNASDPQALSDLIALKVQARLAAVIAGGKVQ